METIQPIIEYIITEKEFIFMIVLSVFLGVEVISNVPAVLHTPLMSGANMIHGVVIVGAIIVMGSAESTTAMVLTFPAFTTCE